MSFGLENVETIFSWIVVIAFTEYMHKFLEVYLDDWMMFDFLKKHIEVLWLMLDRCT